MSAAAKRPGQWLLGFAAESESPLEHAATKLARKGLDAILAKGDQESGAAKAQIAAFAAAVRKLEAASPQAAAYGPGSIL